MKRILFVFAHPDDESFTTGGTIAKYVAQGDVDIHLICATRGEAGKTGNPPQCTKEELPKVREQELERAAAHLGIHHLHFLPYKDGTLPDVPLEDMSQDIITYMKNTQPQVVVTFAPHGISGHKDHTAISQATFKAVSESNLPSIQKLYYITIPGSVGRQMSRQVNTDPDEAIHTIVDVREYKEPVRKALLEYKTQNMSVDKVFPGIAEGHNTSIPDRNHYILAWPHPPSTIERVENDLFVGIES
ncbi:PIG-L deacetylase family protein [Thermoflavimicrobium daqui]|jgi:LmbE family N-acetylglucosaminyl deacetylase|uniref:PIG-L domain-containing protein n=1 Tax=Thermoflavimicrobium daqui TaxID=2137476 RepID=A0A364K7I5_9BACL|nr:PIG-L family deacetylase [Thermoflavimicrobium daqui]RAL26238.1 PIG-L domain-containing protein [Thermoflavimicrobium daqui]